MMSACLHGRTLTLTLAPGQTLRLPLDHGRGARVVVSNDDSVGPLLRCVESIAGVSLLPMEGGLLAGMRVSTHFALALGLHGAVADEGRPALDHRLRLAWAVCGVGENEARRLGRSMPQALTTGERWLCGLVLQMLRPFDVLVVDRPFARLSRREMAQACERLDAFRCFNPFRPLLLVDVDVPGLPSLPWLRDTVVCEEVTCPC